MHTYAIYQDSEIEFSEDLIECAENVLQGFYADVFDDVKFVTVHDNGMRATVKGDTLRLIFATN